MEENPKFVVVKREDQIEPEEEQIEPQGLSGLASVIKAKMYGKSKKVV